MWDYFAEHAKAFRNAMLGSYPVWAVVLFIGFPDIHGVLLVVTAFLKIMYAGVLGIVTGFCTVLGKYAFDRLKNKLTKPKSKNNGRQKDKAA
jgi:hypothetical protein